MQNVKSQDIYCKECGSVKTSRFCDQCQKETQNSYRMTLGTGKYFLSGRSIKFGIKRGEISWAYSPIAYGVLLTISVGVIQIIECLIWYYRIILILTVASIWFYLCFFNGRFKEFIIRFFNKSKELIYYKK